MNKSLSGGAGAGVIAIVVPSLNPDHTIVELVRGLRNACGNPIIAVDDGSREPERAFFEELKQIENVEILRHSVNLGKGRALKTAFNHFLDRYGESGLGCITVDGDGQHAVPDILKCVAELAAQPDRLVLGVRDFSLPGIPFKSRFGNNLTKWIFRVTANCRISDTQTGLRGIGREFMKTLMNTPGERFEFETEMLLAAKRRKVKFAEVPIATIYLDQNRATHFDPISDSIKIYSVIFRRASSTALHFFCSAVASAVIDLTLFSLLYYFLIPILGLPRLFFSVAPARVISAFCNYLMNRNLVFRTRSGWCDRRSLASYVILCFVVMLASYYLTRLGLWLMPKANATAVKAAADGICFILSYYAQKIVIFGKRTKEI